MDVFTVRLMPGDDLQKCLVKFIQDKGLSNGFIITCVGSLTKAVIRMANANVFKTYEGHFEIVSLVGTVDPDGQHHLHISISDADGNVFGGHVLSDHIIYTTAEIVIGSVKGEVYKREQCDKSGWPELVVQKEPLKH